MTDIFFETNRLIISPLISNDYENVTKLYTDINNNSFATGVFENITENEVENKIKFASNIETGFILAAKQKKTDDFIGYIKGYFLQKNKGIWINTFIIVPQMRKMGYGSEIINSLTCYLSVDCSIKCVYLSVLDENLVAKIFWNSLNFNIEKTLLKSVLPSHDVSKINIFVKYLQ